MHITLNTNVINALDVSKCKPRAPYFGAPCGSEHYRLLCYLSSCIDNVLFIDIGTNEGDSAIALGYNRSNRVMSFDIQPYTRNEIPNCMYLVENYRKYEQYLKESSIILYDIPHHGDDFVELCNLLNSWSWEGFLILDDYLYDPVKQADWNRVTIGQKIDATKYGHFSGTGIINFSTMTEFKME